MSGPSHRHTQGTVRPHKHHTDCTLHPCLHTAQCHSGSSVRMSWDWWWRRWQLWWLFRRCLVCLRLSPSHTAPIHNSPARGTEELHLRQALLLVVTVVQPHLEQCVKLCMHMVHATVKAQLQYTSLMQDCFKLQCRHTRLEYTQAVRLWFVLGCLRTCQYHWFWRLHVSPWPQAYPENCASAQPPYPD